MTIQTTQASEATQAVASLAEAAVAASQEMQQGATVTMALNRYVCEGEPWGLGRNTVFERLLSIRLALSHSGAVQKTLIHSEEHFLWSQ